MGVWGLKLCPLILSLEFPGAPVDHSMRSLLETVQHEMTHQVLTEGLIYKETASRRPQLPRFNVWIREGFATWMEMYHWSDESMRFVVRYVRETPLAEGSGKNAEGRLLRITQMKDRMKKIEDFTSQGDEAFNADGLDAYAQACALTLFLLSHSAESRACLFALSHSAHLREAEKDAFAKAFADYDMDALNAAFKEWIGKIQFEE
jgi:hypothetical protein